MYGIFEKQNNWYNGKATELQVATKELKKAKKIALLPIYVAQVEHLSRCISEVYELEFKNNFKRNDLPKL